MKIALGTTSEQKKAIVERVAVKTWPDLEILSCDVPSGIADQPLSLDETIMGSINRATHASQVNGDFVYAIGMEAGLQKWNDVYYLVCSVAINDHQNSFIGLSSPVPVPNEVSRLVLEGLQFGEEIRKYRETKSLDQKMQLIIDELINRSDSFSTALERALEQLLNKGIFKP